MTYALAFILAALAIAYGVLLAHLRRVMRRAEREHQEVMRALTSDRDEMQAALASMVDAVLAVDLQRRLISFNDAAAGLLELQRDAHAGLPIEQAIASEPVRRFIDQSLESAQSLVTDIELPGEEEPRLFQATGSVLRHRNTPGAGSGGGTGGGGAAGGPRIGSLIVLHDVTRLRRLEVVRRDFVSNASHEIRTPVAAIKMAADTLCEEGEAVDPTTARRFVEIIARQADRLHALIDDLLSLARIERDTDQRRVTLETRPILAVLRSAAETCQTAAGPRGSRIDLDCPPDLSAPINPPLLEQAVMNLLDNAIKYSPQRSTVRCRAHRFNGELIISVVDPGAGIEAEHLPRIFERFYRTDRARSRELGGTGLGLAIVKHVALAHGGRVSADSRLGHGSTFRLHLPGGN